MTVFPIADVPQTIHQNWNGSQKMTTLSCHAVCRHANELCIRICMRTGSPHIPKSGRSDIPKPGMITHPEIWNDHTSRNLDITCVFAHIMACLHSASRKAHRHVGDTEENTTHCGNLTSVCSYVHIVARLQSASRKALRHA